MRHEAGVRAVFTASEGDIGGVVLESSPREAPRSVTRQEVVALLTQTRDFWRGWVARSHYRGRWREHVERSAITLSNCSPTNLQSDSRTV